MNQFKPSRKPMIGVFALLASLSAPLAFAQSTDAAAPQGAAPVGQAAAHWPHPAQIYASIAT